MSDAPDLCGICVALGLERRFLVSRRMERMWHPLGSPLGQVETADTEALMSYCKSKCRDERLATLLRGLGIPMPFGPIGGDSHEPCSICLQPIDTTRWHMAVVAEDETHVGGRLRRQHVRYLTRVCPACGLKVAAWKS